MPTMPAPSNQSVQSSSFLNKLTNNKLYLFLVLGVLAIVAFAVFRAIPQKQQEQTQRELLQSNNSGKQSSLSDLLGGENSGVQSGDISEVGQTPVSQENLPPVDSALVPSVAKDTIISIVSSKQIYSAGEMIEATVVLATSVVPDGVELAIKYDPAQLPQVTLESINSFGSFLSQKVDVNQGIIKAVFIRNPQDQPDLKSQLSLMKISGIVAKTGVVSLNFDQQLTQVAAAGGQDVLQDMIDLTLTVK